MRLFGLLFIVLIPGMMQSCSSSRSGAKKTEPAGANERSGNTRASNSNIPARKIDTKNVSASELVDFAETLVGVKYKYGSAKKEQGFDCSGFITYVFSHFNILVPRSSKDFTNAGKPIALSESKKGDLILFTGSDTTGWIVGHMGIITQNKKGDIRFIHSASGNGRGVMISSMTTYFSTRFVKVIRVFY